MNDVLIRRCTLRIVRHGGWSWGADRRTLLEQATAALPRLIAERIAELLPAGDGAIEEPIRLRIPIRTAEFVSNEDLARIITSSVRSDTLRIAAPEASSADDVQTSGTAAIADQVPETTEPSDSVAIPARLVTPHGILARWRDHGELWQRLQGFSLRALELWLQALLIDTPAHASEPLSLEVLREESEVVLRMLPSVTDEPASAARARLMIAVELAARHATQVSGQVLAELLDEILPIAAGAGNRSGSHPQVEHEHGDQREEIDAFAGRADRSPPALPASNRVRRELAHEVKLCSVLPYVVLGVLHRLGWQDIATATFTALRDEAGGGAFATALAYKLLPPPERGWHRPYDVLRTAAAFAGAQVPVSAGELATWSRHADGALSPLDDFVVATIARGHDLNLPLLVMRVDSGYERQWLLFDADGGLPVAWASDEETVRACARRFGPCVMLVSTGAATKGLLQGLAADGRSFVTTATPVREDGWQRIRGTPCWAGGAPTRSRRLTEAAAVLPEVEAQALSVTREFLQLRPLTTSRHAVELEHSAALAAATGMGALSWTLWHERETVHPLLALRRFANLDGLARFTRDTVEVRPAFGRRYLDLQRHRLFADIPAPPWLEGRRIVFSGP